MTHYKRNTCRLCGASIKIVLPLNPIPIADGYTQTPPALPVRLYPVNLYACDDCGHMQLADIIAPELLFKNYHFRTAENAAMVPHLKQYADSLMALFRHGVVMEIGSNDGTMLKHFLDAGSRVLGFDPSNVPSCVPKITAFFDATQAEQGLIAHGLADIIIANHVLAHADDLHAMAAGVRKLLAPHGVFVMEVAYGIDMLERRLFDQIHHEHLSYHHILPLVKFFNGHGLRIFHAERNECKGGSIRLFFSTDHDPHKSVELFSLLVMEANFDWGANFAAMLADLQKARETCKPYTTNPAFGAGPGATTLIGQLELTPEYLVDDNPRKQGLYSPWGMPIRAATDPAHETVLLSKRYAAQIMARHGGEWVITL